MSSNKVEYAEPYYIPQLLYMPNDPFKNNQYYLNLIRAYEAWNIEQGDSNIVIGIVDTGYDFHIQILLILWHIITETLSMV